MIYNIYIIHMCDYFCRSSYSNYGQQCGAERIAEFEFGQLRDDLC